MRSIRSVLYGVADDVAQSLLEPVTIARDDETGSGTQCDDRFAKVCFWLKFLNQIGAQLHNVYGLLCECDLLFLKLGDEKEIFDQVRKVFQLAL